MHIFLRGLGVLIVLFTGLNLIIMAVGISGMVRNLRAETEIHRAQLGAEAAPMEKGEGLIVLRLVLSIPPVRKVYTRWVPAFLVGLALIVWG